MCLQLPPVIHTNAMSLLEEYRTDPFDRKDPVVFCSAAEGDQRPVRVTVSTVDSARR